MSSVLYFYIEATNHHHYVPPPRRLHRCGSNHRRRTADRHHIIRFVPLFCRISENSLWFSILYTTIALLIRKQYLPIFYYIVYNNQSGACASQKDVIISYSKTMCTYHNCIRHYYMAFIHVPIYIYIIYTVYPRKLEYSL